MELFPRETREPPEPPEDAPLAERQRPRDLADFEGQAHLLGTDGPLGPVVRGAGTLQSLILWGPPGSGKTTLARLLAARVGLRMVGMSAVLATVKDLREAVAAARVLRESGTRTALLIDEIHRFNKAQQDVLLPHVEVGTVVLLGATTENPSFEVIPALRSRCRVFTLRALEPETVKRILARALADPQHGLGERQLEVEAPALDAIVRLTEGDARRALGLLETTAERVRDRITRADVEAAVEQRLPDYDKGGEGHYDTISAFIKSLRGSDPDAAVYWLVRMLEGGEDPRFICRRMLIFASEDIGNADARALSVAAATAEAFDRVGLPEGRLILSQAATYLASAPKSDASTTALSRAAAAVDEHGSLPVPLHLRNAPTELLRREAYGKGYRVPHAHPGHFVEQQYLPDRLRDARFYHPSDQGDEREIRERLARLWHGTKPDDG